MMERILRLGVLSKGTFPQLLFYGILAKTLLEKEYVT